MTELLPCIEINPTQPPVGSIIWLHGLGADGHDFVSIVSELNLPLRFVFPHAPMMPVTINNGYVMRAWYDIISLNADRHADQLGIEASAEKLRALVAREEELGFPTEKIILAGFSQGAVIALTTALTFPKTLGGVLALSGYLSQAEKIMSIATVANQKTPIFLGHGKEDSIVPHLLGEQLYYLLETHQYSVSWHSYAMAHSVCMEEIQDIAGWLRKIFIEKAGIEKLEGE